MIEEQLLTINRTTRSSRPTMAITGIVMHWVQWPGATAQQIRDYFDRLPITEPGRFASAHYVIGLAGEVIRMIPEDEVAWHAGPSDNTAPVVERLLGGVPNLRTIGIELCHPDSSGAFLRATWRSAVSLIRDIRARRGSQLHLLRHHDCTGKDCPRWFVRNQDDWAAFKEDCADGFT